jgi:RNA polymerase sigma-70 factor (ECF subfamily)
VLSELADEELFRRFRRGERAAFETLLRRHRAPLFSFVLRMVGTDDRPRAEDIVQDAFIRVLKNASGWEERAKFSTWLFTIARNLCVDSMRRERQRRAESLDGAADEDGERGWAQVLAADRAGRSSGRFSFCGSIRESRSKRSQS